MNREWTDEELEILRRDRAAKIPVPVTAAKLGRPVPATYLRARRIGSLVQPHQPWDESSVCRLRELVTADPPLTDKRIAAQLGRTVTQVRWKMKDLDLIGVRDLSKLARTVAPKNSTNSSKIIPAASPARKMPSAHSTQQKPLPSPPMKAASLPPAVPYTPLELALKLLASRMAERLKTAIAESEAGLVQAAKAAIAEKARIDQRLAKLGARAKADRDGTRLAAVAVRQPPVQKRKPKATASKPTVATFSGKAKAEPRPKLPEEMTAGTIGRNPQSESRANRLQAKPPAAQSARLPIVRETASLPSRLSKIVVVDSVAPSRPEEAAELTLPQTSGRGGWKSVRRDPARVATQARAKAANRADAVDLAQAAQAAIERFIAERGVTRTATDATRAVVSRLQARGYIVVRENGCWLIDQRHRIESEADLAAFAEARGISADLAA